MASEQPGMDAELLDVLKASAGLLGLAVPLSPEKLLGFVVHEVQMQEGYAQVLADLADPEARASHPYWGFCIAGSNPQTKERVEIAKTVVPKVLDPKSPEYLAQLAAWTNTYMLVITPTARAAWRMVGFEVQFFQTAQAPDAPQRPKLTLVKP